MGELQIVNRRALSHLRQRDSARQNATKTRHFF
jgi:hypothetical protein